MIGLSILLAVVLYVWLARVVVRRMENRVAKYAVIAVFVLIPTWDIAPGYLYFNYLCSTQGGERIYKIVDNVDGIIEEGSHILGYHHLLKEPYGYKYMEVVGKRYYLGGDGAEKYENITNLKSRYSFNGWPRANLYSSLFKIHIVEFKINDTQTNQTIAKQTAFMYAGGWLNRFVSSIGTGNPAYEICPGNFHDHSAFIFKVLRPSK